MLEVAFAVRAADIDLLGLAGEEFVVEVHERDAQQATDLIKHAATTSAARLLGRGGAVIEVTPSAQW